MDVLSDVLKTTHLKGGVFLNATFFDPWCMASEVTPSECAPDIEHTADFILYHYVIEGEFFVQLEGGEPISVQAGDLILFPRNDPHLMGSDLSIPPATGGDVVREPDDRGFRYIRHGGEGPETRMVCGYLACDKAEGNPLLDTLPPLLKMNSGKGSLGEWIGLSFKNAAEEVARGRLGSETVLAKLSELLFVGAVRVYAESLPEGQTGWLAGLNDPYVAQVLGLFHGDVAHAWTVEEVSREVGLSRSALADRFTRLIGQAPMQYLSDWRMQLAAKRLRESQASLSQIAHQIGYESEAAFSRAFKKAFGQSPSLWRKE